MKKFIKSRSKSPDITNVHSQSTPVLTNQSAISNNNNDPSTSFGVTREIPEWEQKLRNENNRLRQLTQKLLGENVELKERVRHHVDHPPQQNPSNDELKQLLTLVTEENNFLLDELSNVKQQVITLNQEHTSNLSELSHQLESVTMERDALQKNIRRAQIKNDEMRTQLMLINEDSDQQIPLEQHEKQLNEIKHLMEQLKSEYHHQLLTLTNEIDASQSQLQTLALETAKKDAELKTTKKMLTNSNEQSKRYAHVNKELQQKLLSLTEEKETMESRLQQMISLIEKKKL